MQGLENHYLELLFSPKTPVFIKNKKTCQEIGNYAKYSATKESSKTYYRAGRRQEQIPNIAYGEFP